MLVNRRMTESPDLLDATLEVRCLLERRALLSNTLEAGVFLFIARVYAIIGDRKAMGESI